MKFKVVPILLTYLLFPSFSFGANTTCLRGQVEKIVISLGRKDSSSDNLDSLKCLMTDPANAAQLLIKQLHVVSEKTITPENQSQHEEAMHVVWSLRALRYITGGLDFEGATSYSKSTLGLPRWHLLTIRNQRKLTFFGTRMSHDTVYIAPQDVQSSVIQQWQRWYIANGRNFKYKPADSSMEWYF